VKIVARKQNQLSSHDEFTQILSGEIGHSNVHSAE